jgi:hypothetical protein
MKKTIGCIIIAGCFLLSTTVYAGGYGHYGGYRGYGRGYGGNCYRGGYYGHGYYGGCGWNGAYWALGITTAVIGTALVVDALNRPCTTYVYASPPPPVYSYGHWEVQRTWVPGTAERYWVNQYYDPNRNVWVLGHWEERPAGPGYWQETRVWVQP